MKKPFILLALVVFPLLGYIVWQEIERPGGKDLKLALPYTTEITGRTELACSSLMSAHIFGNKTEKNIGGSVDKGTDSIALKIQDNDTLLMTTAANIEAGIAEGDEMVIIENDAQKLTAIWYGEGISGVISSVSINKANGLAVWTKANSDFALLGTPFGSVIYMSCI